MSEQKTEDRKTYSRRPMRGLTASDPAWMQLGDPDGLPLSVVLGLSSDRLFLCGSLEQMSREYVEQPLRAGWEFARPYIHKFRSPVFKHKETGTEVSVKLVGESWLPGCEDMLTAIPAWRALKAEWAKHTDIPLLSTPSKTGQALLWENLPKGVDFPSLPDDLATLIRGCSPQHRLQVFATRESLADVSLAQAGDVSVGVPLYAADGRWMYAGCALTDRLPIGTARKVGDFTPYQPGWHHVKIRIPLTWAHIGLVPVKTDNGEWSYPSEPGAILDSWVSEPELTLALSHGWMIVHHIDGYEFDKGRPLATWAKRLIDVRKGLRGRIVEGCYGSDCAALDYAAKVPREILNHTIGSFHVDTYEREGVVSRSEWDDLVERWGFAKVRTLERLRGGTRRVVYPARHSDRLSIYMPHWSAQIWALERAWIAKHALQCEPSTLVEIRGDAIYSTVPLSFPDDGHLSQLRPKEVK